MTELTKPQMAKLLGVCSRFDGRTLDEPTFDAWYQLLKDVPAEDIEAAIGAHYRTDRRWIMPADIVAYHELLAGDRAIEQLRQNPPPCPGNGCSVVHVLSPRPGSNFAWPVGEHAASCDVTHRGMLSFSPSGPEWGVMPGLDPATFDEAVWESNAGKALARMARYREIRAADPSYGPGGDE